MLSEFLSDARFALRRLAKDPGFAVVALTLLMIGSGSIASIMNLGFGLFLVPPANVADAEELVRACRNDENGNEGYWTYPDYEFFRENLDERVVLAAVSLGEVHLTMVYRDLTISVPAAYVSDNYFDVLLVTSVAGRFFLEGEDRQLTVVSQGLAERVFGKAEAAIGSRISVNGHAVTIIGIVPNGFHGVSPREVRREIWLPVGMYPILNPDYQNPLERGEFTVVWLEVIGRLDPSFSLAAAQANVEAVTAALAREVSSGSDPRETVELRADYRYMPRVAARLNEILTLLGAVVTVVLVVACGNYALLLLNRAIARRKELAVRQALGASRGRVVREVMMEGVLLAAGGSVCGVLLSFWGTNLAAAVLPGPYSVTFGPVTLTSVIAAGLTVSLVLVLSTLPAIGASRTSLGEVVKHGDQDRQSGRIRDCLVVAQAAMAVLLVTASAVFIRSYHAATAVELGFEAKDRLVLDVDLNGLGYDRVSAADFLERSLREISAVAGVEGVSATAMPPFTGMMSSSIRPVGGGAEDQIQSGYNAGGPGYFATMGIPLLAGRDFAATDHAGALPVVAINKAAADRLFPGAEALNRQVTVMGTGATIVAVVGNTRFRNLGKDPPPYAYRPLLQTGAESFTLVAKTATPPRILAKPLEDRIRTLDRRVALTAARPMEALVDRAIRPYRVGSTMVSLFGSLALLLAMVGLYGALLHGVIRSQRRIGIQMALGASAIRIAVVVVRRGVALGVIGFLIGAGAFWGLARFMERFLFQVGARDLPSLGMAPLVLWLAVIVASSYPAWRASQVDPISVLKEE